MARPIESTPVLKGKDAKVFLRQMEITESVSPDRLNWLDQLAKESRAAESKKK
jgi:hypothetical protein